jgi:hypothetical protein
MNDPVDDADDVFLLDIIDPDEEPVDDFLLDAIDSDGSTAGVSDDDADDVFLLDIIDPDEEPVDDFLLDAIDSDGTTGDVSIGISVVLESCGGVTGVCLKTFAPGKSFLSIGLGKDVAIGATLFIVSFQLRFFTTCSSITTPMILSALISPIIILKCYHNLCY